MYFTTLICFMLAVLFFVFSAAGMQVGRLALLPIGLAFLAFGLLLNLVHA